MVGRRGSRRPASAFWRACAQCCRTSQLLHAPGVAIDSEDATGDGAAVELCATSDAILLCLGEAATMSGEACEPCTSGTSRQAAAFWPRRSSSAHKPCTNRSSSSCSRAGRWWCRGWWSERMRCWPLGFSAARPGNAIGDVITGRVSPSGRTPVTWPRADGQIPIFFGERPSGRPADPKDRYTSKYLDVPNEPLFPFGHGLTYGRFSLANLRVTPLDVEDVDTMRIHVDVRNTARGRPRRRFSYLRTTRSRASRGRCSSSKASPGFNLQPGETARSICRCAPKICAFSASTLNPDSNPARWRFWSVPAPTDRSCCRQRSNCHGRDPAEPAPQAQWKMDSLCVPGTTGSHAVCFGSFSSLCWFRTDCCRCSR